MACEGVGVKDIGIVSQANDFLGHSVLGVPPKRAGRYLL
jgi:hypothetical protein